MRLWLSPSFRSRSIRSSTAWPAHSTDGSVAVLAWLAHWPSADAAKPSPLPRLDLPPEARALPLREFRDHMEREYIRLKLDENGWNISRTAALLGIERTNLHKKMRALGLSRDNQGQPPS